jgi:hypothetical protein
MILWKQQRFPLDYMMPFKYNKRLLIKLKNNKDADELNNAKIILAQKAFKLKNLMKNVVF